MDHRSFRLGGPHQVVAAAVRQAKGSLASGKLPDIALIRNRWAKVAVAASAGQEHPQKWSKQLLTSIKSFRSPDLTLPRGLAAAVDVLEGEAKDVAADEARLESMFSYITEAMPTFVYVSDYPDLAGRQNLSEYFDRKASGVLDDADVNFEALMALAGINATILADIRTYDARHQNRTLNEASIRVSKELQKVWKSRKVKIRFVLNNSVLETLVIDADASRDIEINLEDRSKGFQWFFSFYVLFAYNTRISQRSILLLDEPGIHLHPTAQAHLLDLLETLPMQVLYTTHSPFMISPKDLTAVRTVEYDEQSGTKLSNSISGDSDTLFPLQAMLGYALTQTLFVGANSLVVEGVTDLWYLMSASAYLNESTASGLNNEIIITPAGGASKIAYMAALLSAQRVVVLALLDLEPTALRTVQDDILRQKVLRSKQVTFVSSAFDPAAVPTECDIEDILDDSTFDVLVAESYALELSTKTLSLNPSIPRKCRRYELAFEAVGLTFHKTRPAKLFLQRMSRGEIALSENEAARFQRLFDDLNSKFDEIKGLKAFEQ